MLSGTVTAWLARRHAVRLIEQRALEKARRALEERMMRTVQRVARGCLGRKRANERRYEIEFAYKKWTSARLCQKAYRGLLGRRRYAWFLEEYWKKVRNKAATKVQTIFRRYRGLIIGAMLAQLKILRIRKGKAA